MTTKLRSGKHAFALAVALLVAILPVRVLRACPSVDIGAEVSRDLRITILSTVLGGGPRAGAGEWGYSALVQANGQSFLYDTGGEPELVLRNSRALHLDLSSVSTVVLSHNHPDHVGGLLSLRLAFAGQQPSAFSKAMAGEGIFLPRRLSDPTDRTDHNALNAVRSAYEAAGGAFETVRCPTRLAAGIWLTGPVPRETREHNWEPSVRIETASGMRPDEIAEDSALVIATPRGLVVLTGCGHSGIINILHLARKMAPGRPIFAVIGGLHLDEATADDVAWTAEQLRANGVQELVAGHCTGFHALERIRARLGRPASEVVMSAVGTVFTLDQIQQPFSTL